MLMLVDCCVLVFSAAAAAINLSVCLRICDGLSVHLSAYLRLYVCLSVCRSGRRNLNSVRVCLPGRHTGTCHRDSPPTGVCLSESVSQSVCVSESVCLRVCLSPSQCHVTTTASAGPAARPPRKYFFLSPLINSVQIRFPEMIWVFFYLLGALA